MRGKGFKGGGVGGGCWPDRGGFGGGGWLERRGGGGWQRDAQCQHDYRDG